MTLSDVAALGEAIGGIAVLVTLVYLALQTRQNTEALRRALGRDVAEDANAWRYRIVENPEIAEIFRQGLRDPEALSANDRYRFRMFLDALVFHWQHAVLSGVDIPSLNITRTLSQPGGAWYWTRSKDLLDPVFVEKVDRLLAD